MYLQATSTTHLSTPAEGHLEAGPLEGGIERDVGSFESAYTHPSRSFHERRGSGSASISKPVRRECSRILFRSESSFSLLDFRIPSVVASHSISGVLPFLPALPFDPVISFLYLSYARLHNPCLVSWSLLARTNGPSARPCTDLNRNINKARRLTSYTNVRVDVHVVLINTLFDR